MNPPPLLLLTLLLLLAAPTRPATAAVGWVGNMFPIGGSNSSITLGNSFDVYIQVWKDGVTNFPGQGAGITCALHWGQSPNPWTDTPMTYHGDVGNNDEYKATITPATAGTYGFTAWCSDDGGTTKTWQGAGDGTLTVSAPSSTITDARAQWLDTTTIAWNGTTVASYRLLFDPDGDLNPATAGASPCAGVFTAPCYVPLTPSGTVSGYPKNPNATGMVRLTNSLTNSEAKTLLRGQTAVAAYNGGGDVLQVSGTQIQSVLDYLYVDNGTADSAVLGVTYSGTTPSLAVWAPTAQTVTLHKFATSTTPISTTHTMTRDDNSGVWSITGDSSWDRQYFLLNIQVFVPISGTVQNNLITDPYAVSLSTDSLRSQFVNLNDGDLKPAGWDSTTKPDLENFEDITIYEMHIRDFSINDSTVITAHRGTYMAFTYDGQVNPLSDGMAHLLALQEAGLSHVHLLPTFDIATIPEANVPRTVSPNPTGFGRASDQQQSIVGTGRMLDGFNWGYDPFHYGVPEGSYATDPDGAQRILEFRHMVQTLNENGLRVVMDVVYNHTAASGQTAKSVLDKVVPGYYHRYTNTGALHMSSCCDDTATEYAMMEKLMIDTLIRFAVDYKVDGFRFDLMNLHTKRNMENVQDAITAVDPKIYLYGEGWTFGSAQAKGFTDCTGGWCFADKYHMGGVGIGLFNDIIRDAAHGGYSQDSLQIRQQGFINGLSYDWNGYEYANRFQIHLHNSMNTLRSGLRASGADWSGAGAPFATDPQESMPYVSKHDNETLFDQNVFKMPIGVSMAERVRAQNMGLSLVGLSQGVPFFHMASDILRSKSLDRNSYDSGDWFNRVYWDLSHNNFAQGLPPAWDNSSRWGIMTPLLENTALDPTTADMQASSAHFREILRIRQSSPLFRLTTMAEVNDQVIFFNGDNSQDALLVMGLVDSGDLDPNYETILVFFNAHKIPQTFTIPGADNYDLHPIHEDGIDDDPILVAGAFFDDATDTFTVPARTTAVFVSADPIAPPPPPSTIGFVGLMFPRGGVVTGIDEGAFVPAGFDVFVQVYAEGITPGAGQGAGIACYLHWGQYGQPWTDVPMSYNGDIGNNDEYKATLPQATLNALASGSYGFNAYCQKPSEAPKWKQDVYNINSAGDDDQGDGLITILPTADSMPAPAGGVFVHLFEWPWADVAKECSFLAQAGYTAVQVSPPNEHLVPIENQGGQPASDYPWWVRYQPVTHDLTKLNSRSGSLAQFQTMLNTCNAAGVDVYVDAVINHMAYEIVGNPATGTAGTEYDNGFPNPTTRFYGDQYGADDFHMDCNILSYSDRAQVQNCKLSGLPDLDTGSAYVQGQLHGYLQGLLDMGVAGFRVDGAKHMAAYEIAAIVAGLTRADGGQPYIYYEVIDTSNNNERIRDWEYAPHGDVSEFEYSVTAMGTKFNCGGNIADLQTLPSYASMMASRFAVVFTDNHDNQRGHGPGGGCIVDHRDGQTHVLANVFTLAYPYGHPMLTSSYYWTTNPNSEAGDSLGPPSTNDGGTTWGPGLGSATRPVYGAGQTGLDYPAHCSGNYPSAVTNADLGYWVCEHRHPALANMVGFRAATHGEAATDWETVNPNHIAFGRGQKGFVVINNGLTSASRTYQTSLPAGRYCDIIKGTLAPGGAVCTGPVVVVNGSGQFTANVAGHDALAIHIAQRITPPTLSIGDVSVVEGNSGTTPAVFVVTLSAASDQPITVDYATADGTATAANNDYQPTSGTLTFAPSTITQTITVLVNGDTAVEPNETFTVVLSNPSNATIAQGTGTGTIINDDGAVLSIADASVVEGTGVGGTLRFTVTLSQASAETVTVQYASADGSAVAPGDYAAVSGTLTFAPGELVKIIEVQVVGDDIVEPDETLTITLSNATNATIGRAVATGTILDDDEEEPEPTVWRIYLPLVTR